MNPVRQKYVKKLLWLLTVVLITALTISPVMADEELVLVIVPGVQNIDIGDTAQFTAYLSPDSGATLTNDVTSQCLWMVDDPSIAEIGPTEGSFIGISDGATTVRAQYTEQVLTRAPRVLEGQARLSVSSLTLVEFSLKVLPETALIEVGEVQQYEAFLHRSNSAEVVNVTSLSTWDLSDPIATEASDGRYRGIQEGTAEVRATYEGIPEGFSGSISVWDTAQLEVWQEEPEDTPEDEPEDEPEDVPEDEPETEDLPEGKILDRQPGYQVWGQPQYLANPGDEITMNYDDSISDGNPNRYPKVFYWNDAYEKWVALASYPLGSREVKALNDGDYSGWFVVFGCIQPRFTDVEGSWAEPTANRMNGLGLLSGYEDPNNPGSLVRPAGLNRTITRAELTTVVAKILGLAPGDTHLYPTITFKSDQENSMILEAHYSDADEIAGWARPFIASMTDAELVRGKGDRFAPQDEMTRIEAAVLISDALRDIPDFGIPANLEAFTDYESIPSWAIGEVAQGTVSGYPDGSLRPNQPINRAESLSLLLKLLKGLGW